MRRDIIAPGMGCGNLGLTSVEVGLLRDCGCDSMGALIANAGLKVAAAKALVARFSLVE
jgi:hypothetical protein